MFKKKKKSTQRDVVFPTEILLQHVSEKYEVLTCDCNGEIHTYNMLPQKATEGELVYIVKRHLTSPFDGNEYIGRCFTSVISNFWQTPGDDWIDIKVADKDGYNYYWRLFNDQYVVLQEVKKGC